MAGAAADNIKFSDQCTKKFWAQFASAPSQLSEKSLPSVLLGPTECWHLLQLCGGFCPLSPLSVLSHGSETERLRRHRLLCMTPTSPRGPLQPSGPIGCVNVIRPAFPASAEELHAHIYCCCYSKGWMTFFSPCGRALPVHLSPLPPSLQGLNPEIQIDSTRRKVKTRSS